jgi:hypothetical protein
LAHARGVSSAHTYIACAACARWAGLSQRGPRRRSAAHAGAVTAPAHASWCGRRRRHNGGDDANGGGRAPTRVRLPAGHGGRNASSPELLVDGEEKKSGSAAASLRRGGVTVAGGGPATVRWEGRVRSTLHGQRTVRGELGRRSPWSCSRQRRRPGNGDGSDALGQRGVASSDRGARTQPVGAAAVHARRGG